MWKGIFAPDFIENAFVGVSISEVLIWRRVLIWITQRDLLTFALYKLLLFGYNISFIWICTLTLFLPV